jgi:tetratricopeptide (TPR) repeat protein
MTTRCVAGCSSVPAGAVARSISAAPKRSSIWPWGRVIFVPYAEAWGYAEGIKEALEAIPQFLAKGRAEEALELAEYAIELLDGELDIDDSDGALSDVFEHLLTLHLRACRKAKPDPEMLAARLLQWELHDVGMIDSALDQYETVLGKKGVAAYVRLVEAKWKKLPDGPPAGEGRRIFELMKMLAGRTGDVEALVAIETRDLSSWMSYLRIAQEYQKAGKPDAALEWAEKGLAAFPDDWHAGGLRGFVVEEYQRRGRHGEAMELIWTVFARQPGVSTYEVLHIHAKRAGDWHAWRSKALDVFRRAIATPRGPTNRWPPFLRSDRSELVRVFLWESDVEAAWQEAQEGGCSPNLWLDLASKREKSHPEDALRVYLAQVDPAVRSSSGNYDDAIRLLEKAKRITDQLDRPEDFRACIARLRMEHRRRRNLMTALDRKKR